MYFVFEWVVWVGKSTQSKRLVAMLEELYPNKNVERIREPWSTEIAEAIRTLVQWTTFEETMLPITNVYLYASARAQLLHWKVKKHLDAWDIVISDRSVVSSLAYQWYAQWYWMDNVWKVNAAAVEDVLPDCILFMDLDIEVWYKRTFDADWDKRETKPLEFFRKIYEWYHQCSLLPLRNSRRENIDASWTIDEVYERVESVVLGYIERIRREKYGEVEANIWFRKTTLLPKTNK